MGSSVEPSFIRAVLFSRLNRKETLREVWDEDGISFVGIVPPGVRVGDSLVVHPHEGETWWMHISGTEEELKAGRVRASWSMIRVRSEVEYLQMGVEEALLRFASREFPSSEYRVVSARDDGPLRGVALFAVGPEKPLHYGSGGKMSKGWRNLVLGDLPHERDVKHPYVSSIKVAEVGREVDLRTYRIRAEIT